MRKLLEELQEGKAGSYDDEMADIVGMHLKDIPESVKAAINKKEDPMIVGLALADALSRIVLILGLIHSSTKNSQKLKAANAKLDKIPTLIRQAVRVNGFG